MKNYLIYNSEGTILRTGICPDDMFEIQAGQDEFIMEGKANDILHYIVADAVADKPAMSLSISKPTLIADGIDSIIISGLPNPCDVWIGDSKYVTTDGSVEFTVDISGIYVVKCEAFPYIPYIFEVTAT